MNATKPIDFIFTKYKSPPTTHRVVILRCSCGRERATFAHEAIYANAPELVRGDWQRVQEQYVATYRDPLGCLHGVK